MTNLSVNINKVATIRNARGGNVPNVAHVALDCERFGADGITVHPRPDERHIRQSDVYELRPLLRTEFNIEGYPSEPFMDLVLKVKPAQVTLVPDAPDVLTSSCGWDVTDNLEFLTQTEYPCGGAYGSRPGGVLHGALRHDVPEESGGGSSSLCGGLYDGAQCGSWRKRRPRP